ncbi:hypothetical protein LTR70_006970 [Exophiala xenobiotica]|uniref:Uncharacterized protein n=1 Tax=Lithohypha guttulata TaxID=1690604 RepID=A0ABR0K5V9_9EURO|nr:hypothetical protein LTR24_006490 [Lithohypha guttulata]KAK5314857.1 hypothetical protein LTR70_006970 [Exophiala xenobiotica]
MPDEEDGFASKILLMRAGNKSRAQSWLKASLGEETEEQTDTATSATESTNDVFADLKANEEYSGIGLPKKQIGDDDLGNRQLLTANDALRKKLLSKEAYQRYQQGSPNRLDASKPMPKTEKRRMDDDSGDEEKGRSLVARPKFSKVEGANDTEYGGAPQVLPSKSRKRPGSYLDQLLAERGKKKKSKSQSEDG